MLLDVGFLVHHLDKVFLFAALLIFLKSILSLPPMLLVGYPLRVSILAAMSLAQIGEFSFVLARSAVNSGLMDNDGYQMFLSGEHRDHDADPHGHGNRAQGRLLRDRHHAHARR